MKISSGPNLRRGRWGASHRVRFRSHLRPLDWGWAHLKCHGGSLLKIDHPIRDIWYLIFCWFIEYSRRVQWGPGTWYLEPCIWWLMFDTSFLIFDIWCLISWLWLFYGQVKEREWGPDIWYLVDIWYLMLDIWLIIDTLY